jgi:hypothetical protein
MLRQTEVHEMARGPQPPDRERFPQFLLATTLSVSRKRGRAQAGKVAQWLGLMISDDFSQMTTETQLPQCPQGNRHFRFETPDLHGYCKTSMQNGPTSNAKAAQAPMKLIPERKP